MQKKRRGGKTDGMKKVEGGGEGKGGEREEGGEGETPPSCAALAWGNPSCLDFKDTHEEFNYAQHLP